MRKVELRMNEEYKYKIIKKLVETKGNKQRAAVKLKRSVRQIDRMISKMIDRNNKETIAKKEQIFDTLLMSIELLQMLQKKNIFVTFVIIIY